MGRRQSCRPANGFGLIAWRVISCAPIPGVKWACHAQTGRGSGGLHGQAIARSCSMRKSRERAVVSAGQRRMEFPESKLSCFSASAGAILCCLSKLFAASPTRACTHTVAGYCKVGHRFVQ